MEHGNITGPVQGQRRCKRCAALTDDATAHFCWRCGGVLPQRRSAAAQSLLTLLKCIGIVAVMIGVQFLFVSVYTVIVSAALGFGYGAGVGEEYFVAMYAGGICQVEIAADFAVVGLLCLIMKIRGFSMHREVSLRPAPLCGLAGVAVFGASANVLVSAIVSLAYSLWPWLQENSSINNDYSVQLQQSMPAVWSILLTVIVTPLVEEFVFRGLVFTRLRKVVGKGTAVVLSAVIFGAAHMNIEQGVYAFAIGLVMAMAYEKYGSIWASVALHFAFNGFDYIKELLIPWDTATGFISAIFVSGGLILLSLGLVFGSRISSDGEKTERIVS